MRYRKIVNQGIKLEFGKESTGERYGGMNKNIKKKPPGDTKRSTAPRKDQANTHTVIWFFPCIVEKKTQ